MKMYRQGDLLFLKIGFKPDISLYDVKDGIILRGEGSGHAHRLVNGKLMRSFQSMSVGNTAGNMVIFSKKGTKVVHEEHGTIEFEMGMWLVIRQREYTPFGLVSVLD